jgi:primosomal protein N' (replication factor Y)
MRFDTDNVASEQLHKHIQTIKDGEVDILVGTQLITKGIDLPNLGLVGVVNADTGLNLPDFRAEELTFQQLHQVVGRIDRGHRKGFAIIQTRVPQQPVMQAVLNRDWDAFAEYELHKRKQYKYPPYSFIAQFEITKKTTELAEREAQKGIDLLLNAKLGLQLLGPSPSFYEQSANGITWHIIAKGPKRSQLVAAARLLPSDWRSDIDPLNLL